jgi:hypothetical protein
VPTQVFFSITFHMSSNDNTGRSTYTNPFTREISQVLVNAEAGQVEFHNPSNANASYEAMPPLNSEEKSGEDRLSVVKPKGKAAEAAQGHSECEKPTGFR